VGVLIGRSSVFVSSFFLLFAALVLNDWLRERLNPKCSRCGTMNGEEARFCSQCGAPLSGDSGLPRLVIREEH
jgi:predicted amidophosphoribosyltransferase